MYKIRYIYKMTVMILICTLISTPILVLLQPNKNLETNETTKNETNNNTIYYDSMLHSQMRAKFDYTIAYDNTLANNEITIKPTTISRVGNIYIAALYDEVEDESVEEQSVNNEEETIIADEYEISESESQETSETITDNIDNEVKVNNSSYSEQDIYELAKIIMCEVEGSSQLCKEYVGQVVINRYKSGNYGNTIHDVIFQNNGRVYQFSPVKPGGRWYRVEPNQDCYDAAYSVINAETPFTDALYFEDCNGPSWHSRNLTKVAEIDGMRFYIK